MNLPEPFSIEFENIDKVLHLLNIVVKRPEISEIELSAKATYLHNIYNGFENCLKHSFKLLNKKPPSSANWHRDLLLVSVQAQIISPELKDKLIEYLAFRHFFIYAYGFMLKEDKMSDLVNNIPEIVNDFKSEIIAWLKENKFF